MNFTRIQIGKKPHAYTYWISGIYKIVSYRKGAFSAFFIQEWFNNWGDHVSPPPDRDIHGHDCWLTLKAAKKACFEHAKDYAPSKKIVNRAIEIKAALILEHS